MSICLGHTGITAEGGRALFCLSSTLLLVISPFQGSILLQHVERLQLLHDIVSLGQPLLCLRNRVRYILSQCMCESANLCEYFFKNVHFLTKSQSKSDCAQGHYTAKAMYLKVHWVKEISQAGLHLKTGLGQTVSNALLTLTSHCSSL